MPAPTAPPPQTAPTPTRLSRTKPRVARLSVSGLLGVVAAVVTGLFAPWQAVPLMGWLVFALTWTLPVWATVARMDPAKTSAHATREDPHGPAADALLLGASIAALGAVILGIVKAAKADGSEKTLLLTVGIGAIVASWGVVHTVFALRYAALYYSDPGGGVAGGGVDFNEDDKPCYADFAYLAFTIGMTYQVSDTNLTTKPLRHAALRHALLSYVLGTVIIAATINVAAGLAH